MTEYKARIKLAPEPWKIIKWFTHNFKHEVGAVGIGGFKDGDLYVEKLIFPNQIVNGAHVHFKPEDWAPIIKELSEGRTKAQFNKDFGRICFYWHKHPSGSASASQGDEEHTFDVFMSPEERERTHFGFLQTAPSTTGNGMLFDGRIDLREPLFCSITDCEVITDEDEETEKICEEIIKTHITEGTLDHTDQKKEINAVSTQTHLRPLEETVDNNLVLDVYRSNGTVFLECSNYLKDWAQKLLLEDLKGLLNKVSIKNGAETITFALQPKKKCHKKVVDFLDNVINKVFTMDSVSTPATICQQPLTVDEVREETLARCGYYGANYDAPMWD